MNRYININKLKPITVWVEDSGYGLKRMDVVPVSAIHEQLTVDKCGEWYYCEDETGQDGYKCNCCGEFFPWYYQYYKTPQDFIHHYNFCPNCGVPMQKNKERYYEVYYKEGKIL